MAGGGGACAIGAMKIAGKNATPWLVSIFTGDQRATLEAPEYDLLYASAKTGEAVLTKDSFSSNSSMAFSGLKGTSPAMARMPPPRCRNRIGGARRGESRPDYC